MFDEKENKLYKIISTLTKEGIQTIIYDYDIVSVAEKYITVKITEPYEVIKRKFLKEDINKFKKSANEKEISIKILINKDSDLKETIQKLREQCYKEADIMLENIKQLTSSGNHKYTYEKTVKEKYNHVKITEDML